MKPTTTTSTNAAMKEYRHERPDNGDAFLPDTVSDGGVRGNDATFFAEEFVASALSGEPVEESARDELASDEDGGPFIILDEDGHLPPEMDGGEDELVTAGEEVALEQARGGRWAATGA